MPTSSTNLSMPIPTVGSDADSWGGYLNSSLNIIDGLFDPTGAGTSVGINIATGKTLRVNNGTVNIDGTTGSTIDGCIIGGSDPKAGTFTSLTATSATVSGNTSISGGTLTINPSTTGAVDRVNIGATTPGTGAFTTGSFSGNVTAPTQSAGDNSTKVATTAFVTSAVSALSGLGTSTFLTTPGSSSTTVPAGATKMRAIIVGGGASGQGEVQDANEDVIGGGGGCTAIWEVTVTPAATVNYTVAAGAAAQSGSAGTGTNGNTSSVTYNGQSVTAGGGTRGGSGGAGGTVSTTGSPTNVISIPGQDGGVLSMKGNPNDDLVGYASGGSSLYGQGGPTAINLYVSGTPTLSASPNGKGYGAGGSGHMHQSTAGSILSGTGAQGLVILQFFA